MSWTSLNPSVAVPEMFLLGASCFILLVDAFIKDPKRYLSYALTLISLAVCAYLLTEKLSLLPAFGFNELFIVDLLATLVKLGIILSVVLVLIYGRQYAQQRGLFRTELFVILLFAALGMMVMASAFHFLVLYLGLELLSLSLCVLLAFQRDSQRATEAAMKYFVLAALASGLLLYGMSMVYGATQSLAVLDISDKIANDQGHSLLAVFGLVFIVVGIGFKLGAVPFHMWVPDVYEGAPTPIIQLLGSAPKLAAFAFIIRLLAQALAGLASHWEAMFVILAMLSLLIGNLAALAQRKVKRMLAYSTIAHMGFFLCGLLVGGEAGYTASFFYVVAYTLTVIAAFGMILLLSREGFEPEEIDDFKGLNQRHPWFAWMMLLVMFSMAGIPASLGFFSKFMVIQALVGKGFVGLAVFAVLLSVVGAAYYLRVVKVMFFDPPRDKTPIVASDDTKLLLSLNCLLLLFLGVMPNSVVVLLGSALWHSLPV